MSTKKEVRQDPTDNLITMEIQSWSVEKHERLRRYITATSGVRKKFTDGPGGAAYIDVYCGPGRCFLKGTNTFIDGSPLVAQNAALDTGVPFTDIIINDYEPAYIDACKARLTKLKIVPATSVGKAVEQIKSIVEKVPKYAFAIAFVDPYNLVPFSVLKELSRIKRMDLLVHVSVSELQRNLDQYFGKVDSPLEAFAPGITAKLKQGGKQQMRHEVLEYWKSKILELDMSVGQREELITTTGNLPMYHLVLVSRSPLADRIWSQVAKLDPQKELWG